MSDWITGNRYLSQSEMEHNALILADFFRNQGWTDNAIAGMLGNMQTESSINPGIWQSLKPYSGGYGLVQWTPYTNYSDWAGEGWEDNGDKECERIIYELENGLQYYQTAKYPISFREFSTSTFSPEYLAQAFLFNYERPANKNQPQRSTQARAWYEFIGGTEPPDPPPDPPVPPGGYVPAWLLYEFKRRRW